VSPLDVPAPMPVGVAEHIAAVALFGKPSTRFMRAINDPTIVIGPSYVAKTVDLCVDDDLVCDPQGRSFSVHNQYAETGTVNRGAVFAAQRLQADWAADAQTSPAGAEPAPLIPPTASPLLFSAPAAPSEHLPSMPQTLSGPATTARPPEVPPAASATPFPD
jgi:hypothetical protein